MQRLDFISVATDRAAPQRGMREPKVARQIYSGSFNSFYISTRQFSLRSPITEAFLPHCGPPFQT